MYPDNRPYYLKLTAKEERHAHAPKRHSWMLSAAMTLYTWKRQIDIMDQVRICRLFKHESEPPPKSERTALMSATINYINIFGEF